MTAQPGIYEGPLPSSFLMGRCVLDLRYAAGDSPDDADDLPESRIPERATLELTPGVTGTYIAAGVLYGPVGATLTTTTGRFDFWAIDPTHSDITPAGWVWKGVLKVDGVVWSRFEFTPDSSRSDVDGPLNIAPMVHAASASTAPAQVSLAETLRAQFEGMVQGYAASTISGAKTISAATGAWALDLAGDTTLTIEGKNGQVVALDLLCNSHTLTVVDGPAFNTDGVASLIRSRDLWKGGSAGGSTVRTVTPAAPTFTDDPAGGGIYTIPTSTGITYRVGGVVRAAGDYPVTGQTITVVASVADPDKYELAAGAVTSWSHTFSAGATLVAEHDFATDADSTAPSGLTMTNGATITTTGVPAIQAGRFGLFDLTTPNQRGYPAQASLSCTVSLPKSRRTLPGAKFVGTDAQTSVLVGAYDGAKSIVELRVKADGGVIISGWEQNAWSIVAGSGAEAWTSVSANGWTTTATITGGIIGALSVDWDATTRTATFWIGGTKIGAIQSSNIGAVNVGGIQVALAGFNGEQASIARPQIWALP
ncbi:hypothetical protein IEE94_11265 [Yimella sp. cx-573]|nr:hypothetical protein [Yimella sp. cx-573]